jgi:UDP-N-acetylmuramoyl-tripeptide--D-alanyl-D-alanine ligase
MRAVTIRELVNAVQGRPIRVLLQDMTFERVETDSRRIRPGDLFWALKGANHDGHDYLAEAAERGAVACVGEQGRVESLDLPVIAVPDTQLALWDFASWYRTQISARIIGVTGSVGKTSTRHMIYSMLSSVLPGTESPGNFNNEIGVPLSLLGINDEDQFASIELAAAKAGDIGDLTRIARPEIGVITSVAPCHLATFGSLEEIARTKGELLDYLPEDGLAILNGDDEWVREMACFARCNVIQVGVGEHCDLRAESVHSDNGFMKFLVDGDEYAVQAPGTHWLTSALAAIAIGREFGLSSDSIQAGLAEFLPVPGRCKAVPVGEWTVIDDSYNASPASMAAACEVLRNWQGASRKILVTGDMLELGQEAENYHTELGKQAARAGIDGLISIGEFASTVLRSARSAGMSGGCLAECRRDEIAELLLDCWLEPGAVVLVKGSRAMKMETLVDQIRELARSRLPVELPIRRVA